MFLCFYNPKLKEKENYTACTWSLNSILPFFSAPSKFVRPFLASPIASSSFAASVSHLLKAPRRESHSMHPARRGDTNGCSLGIAVSIFFPLERGSSSYRPKGDRPSGNRSFAWRLGIWHGFSYFSALSQEPASLMDTPWDMWHFLWAQPHCHIAHQNSIAHRCIRTGAVSFKPLLQSWDSTEILANIKRSRKFLSRPTHSFLF